MLLYKFGITQKCRDAPGFEPGNQITTVYPGHGKLKKQKCFFGKHKRDASVAYEKDGVIFTRGSGPRKYIARLPASYRSVVVLSEHEGLTNQEIADALA